MKPDPTRLPEELFPEAENFSLVLGGPFYQVLRRAHLAGEQSSLRLMWRRVIFFSAFTWLPLLLLSTLEHHALDETGVVTFLRDAEAHVRFLLAVPLLLGAELLVHVRMRRIVKQFLQRHLIPDSATGQFEAALLSAARVRNSISAEAALVILVYVVGILVIWRHYVALNTATWYASPSAHGMGLTYAGLWYGYVSLPIFQFLLARGYFRLWIWTRFLWQVSRIELRLIPTHPDGAGGLGFLSGSLNAFGPFAAAHGALLAGQIANRIFYAGAKLTDFKAEIAGLVVFLLCVSLGPMMVFTLQLSRAQRKGNREYGILAERYVREFDTKWLRGGAPADEALIGSADIQSLADLGNSVAVIRGMRIVPFTRAGVIRFVVTILLPLVPLGLTMMNLEDLVKLLFGLVV